MMRYFSILLIFSFTAFSCTDHYYTGNSDQDSIMRYIDNKLKSGEKINWAWSKMLRRNDSIMSFATNTANNELLSFNLAENNASKKTFYDLQEGQLLKVQYFPVSGNRSNFYFFENGKFLYKRQRIVDSINPQKFLDDIIILKRTFGLN